MTVGCYRERLLPHWWAWLLAAALVGMLAVAYGAALGRLQGLAVGILGGVLAVWLVWITAPVVAVDDEGLRAAGARLPIGAIAQARMVDRAEIGVLRGPGADARLFVVLRPWSAIGGVLVTLGDTADPHPAWLLSTRHPNRLLDALTARIGAGMQ